MNLKVTPLLLFIVAIFLSCTGKSTTETGETKDSARLVQDTLGDILYTIDFKVKAAKEERKNFEDGIIPWINIANPELNIERLMEGDRVVLPFKSVLLLVDYPLNTPAVFLIETTNEGFSRKQLIKEISTRYKYVYQEEEKSATTKTIPLEKRQGPINRNQTNGKYGIWGHDITDLDLNAIEVHRNGKGTITLLLAVES
ncbi:hypothetical protein WSM22_31230 [Cytophagales bacterium WSM2-2]|nr:hypothetical protein WSM22_31230 [Cytophagales bacterium WSM2-2]